MYHFQCVCECAHVQYVCACKHISVCVKHRQAHMLRLVYAGLLDTQTHRK